MVPLKEELVDFLQGQGFVILATLDERGRPHSSCKGIVRIEPSGQVYLLDLYHGSTFKNIERNPQVSITAVDEHKFKGYCLKGKASILVNDALGAELMQSWEDRITGRITQRMLRNIGGQRGHSLHPEVLLPTPKCLIEVRVDEVIDLTPVHIKEK